MVIPIHVATALAHVYQFFKKPEMDYYVEMLQLLPQDNYTWIVALYGTASAVNIYSTPQMILCTLYYRRVAYGKLKSNTAVASEKKKKINNKGSLSSRDSSRASSRFKASFATWRITVSHLQGMRRRPRSSLKRSARERRTSRRI